MSEASNILDQFAKTNPNEYRTIMGFEKYYGDTFMDTMDIYIEWRKKTKKPVNFLDRILKNWGINIWIPEYPMSTLKRIVEKDITNLVINDDATISMALSSIIIESKLPKSLKNKAIICVSRQISPVLIKARGYTDEAQAMKVLSDTKQLIENR